MSTKDGATAAPFTIRVATPTDLDALVALRVAMFRETGKVPADDPLTEFAASTRAYLAECLPTGEFRAWVAEAGGEIVGTSGLCFFRRAPTRRNTSGLDAYILNMYTVPKWRGRGVAAALVARILAWVREETPARHVFLHAEHRARPVYERAGFVAQDDVMDLWLD